MKKVTIFKFIRNPRDYSKIIGKKTLRVVNVHDSFTGMGLREEINIAEFRRLADDLEPANDGVNVA